MKKILVWLCLSLVMVPLFSEIIDWKGQELGGKAKPSWLTSVIENSDDTKIRKKFTIENDCFIFYGEGKDFFLSSARELAILSCEKKLNDLCSSNDMSIKISDIKGLITVTDHWYQTSDGIYTYYVFYKISKKYARKSYK